MRVSSTRYRLKNNRTQEEEFLINSSPKTSLRKIVLIFEKNENNL